MKYLIKRWCRERISGMVWLVEIHEFTDPKAAFEMMATYTNAGNYFTVEIVP